MEIKDIITMCENRIVFFEVNKESAYKAGDLDAYNRLDSDLQQTRITLAKLKTLEE
jgi:hypothetical protein